MLRELAAFAIFFGGGLREEVRPGLRTTNYKKRTVVAFEVMRRQLRWLFPAFLMVAGYAYILHDAPEAGEYSRKG